MSKLISYAFCLVVAALVLFAFSPRDSRDQQGLALDLGRVQINKLIRVGSQLVAVGERGLIVKSADEGKTWQLQNSDSRVTLTDVAALDASTLLAVGHDSLILRSHDGGAHWQQVMLDTAQGEPLLGVWSDGKHAYAFGSFGKFFLSSDAGQTWTAQALPISGQHLNSLDGSADGRQVLVGEAGLVLRSDDHGQHWSAVEPFYNGSLFGVALLSEHNWVAYGMRGHVFVSHDDGRNWVQVELKHEFPLYGHAKAAQGAGVVIVGTGGAFVRLDGQGSLGQSGFIKGLGTLTSAVTLADGTLIVAGQRGLLQQRSGLLTAASK
ncbi:YCF48-related protein [Pseudomonas sp. R5(2019)]|uniref:WD40/YVTN/BNR-like repeat-containing protein n=1 Tax=Pseudomonas sp. R5(2019) TaxID=2697566 RepID=UPI001412034D|nr:YCF48-related protein [Pseudomonas sp. R5(2019)]NBA93711.1 glycosyl hydrolase [Pseudomonas sp. R5(2019)]